MHTVALARHAMATRFEFVLHGENPVALRAAGEEALDEIERLEARLSLYRTSSEISHLNARAAREAVRVSPSLLALLRRAEQLSEETAGAFDITAAPLVRCWGFMGGNGRIPEADELAKARACVGMSLVRLDARNFTVRFEREGVMLDLGAIGKGYAVECAAEILREKGVESALIHGGTSTVHAIGRPPEGACWKVAIQSPPGGSGAPIAADRDADGNEPSLHLTLESSERSDVHSPMLAVVSLQDEALSVSAVRGKFFQADGKALGHVLDPRSGRPASDAVLAAVALPSATETDALSTALLVLGVEGLARISSLRPGARALVVAESENRLRTEASGILLETDNSFWPIRVAKQEAR